MKDFAIVFLLQLINYCILVVNFRAVANADIVYTAISDFMIASFNFFVIKRIAKSNDSFLLWAGYTAGSVVGSILGIVLSKMIL